MQLRTEELQRKFLVMLHHNQAGEGGVFIPLVWVNPFKKVVVFKEIVAE